MFSQITDGEKKLAVKLIKSGIASAKISLGRILQRQVSIKNIQYGGEEDTLEYCSKTSGNVQILKTELIGDLEGSGHLIFSEDEITTIYKTCLPPDVLTDDSPNSRMMKEGFLTEIDNMMSSAVITEFADFLSLELFGNVPKISTMGAGEVEPFILSNLKTVERVLHFRAAFQGNNIDISPDFVWILGDKLLPFIKGVGK